VLSDQFLSQLHFGVVEQTKLEVVDLSSLVKVNLVEEDPIVGQGNMESNFVHALDKLPEIELAWEVLVHSAEALPEALKLLDDFEVR